MKTTTLLTIAFLAAPSLSYAQTTEKRTDADSGVGTPMETECPCNLRKFSSWITTDFRVPMVTADLWTRNSTAACYRLKSKLAAQEVERFLQSEGAAKAIPQLPNERGQRVMLTGTQLVYQNKNPREFIVSGVDGQMLARGLYSPEDGMFYLVRYGDDIPNPTACSKGSYPAVFGVPYGMSGCDCIAGPLPEPAQKFPYGEESFNEVKQWLQKQNARRVQWSNGPGAQIEGYRIIGGDLSLVLEVQTDEKTQRKLRGLTVNFMNCKRDGSLRAVSTLAGAYKGMIEDARAPWGEPLWEGRLRDGHVVRAEQEPIERALLDGSGRWEGMFRTRSGFYGIYVWGATFGGAKCVVLSQESVDSIDQETLKAVVEQYARQAAEKPSHTAAVASLSYAQSDEVHLATRFGELTTNKDSAVQFKGTVIAPAVYLASAVRVLGTYQLANADVVLVSIDGGNGCPGQFVYITVTSAAANATPEFGTCYDDEIKPVQNGETISFTMKNVGEGSSKYLYDKGVVLENGKPVK